MIVIFENGMLGNQLSQYCAIRYYSPEEAIVAIGWDMLKYGFEGVDFKINRFVLKILKGFFSFVGEKKLLNINRYFRLITIVKEDRKESGCYFNEEKGYLNSIKIFKGCFFGENLVNTTTLKDLKVKNSFIEKANNILQLYNLDVGHLFFIHARGGLYKIWPSIENPAILPVSWYQQMMHTIVTTKCNAKFIVVSDDREYAEKVNSTFPTTHFSNQEAMVDFALMTLCAGGILSASTFSWWAACFAREEGAKIHIGPQYWAGHSAGNWYPLCARTTWIEYHLVIK